MLAIQTLTAAQATLVELMLIRNKIRTVRNTVTTPLEKFEEFEVSEVSQDWVNEQLAIERKLIRKNPNDYVTFNMMASQNAKLLYDHNDNNLEQQRDQIRSWVVDVSGKIATAGKGNPQQMRSEFLRKIEYSNAQNIFEVYQEVLFWEGTLD
ncbi:MAG: hypothetical protein ABIS36_26680 [Chryseolinea sp.]